MEQENCGKSISSEPIPLDFAGMGSDCGESMASLLLLDKQGGQKPQNPSHARE